MNTEREDVYGIWMLGLKTTHNTTLFHEFNCKEKSNSTLYYEQNNKGHTKKLWTGRIQFNPGRRPNKPWPSLLGSLCYSYFLNEQKQMDHAKEGLPSPQNKEKYGWSPPQKNHKDLIKL